MNKEAIEQEVEKLEWINLGRIMSFGYDFVKTEHGEVKNTTPEAFKNIRFKIESVGDKRYLFSRVQKVWDGEKWVKRTEASHGK